MSRRAIEKFLFRFDKDAELQRAYAADAPAALATFDLTPAERDALARADVAQLYKWGLHALLIRNFAGTLKIRYVDAYKAAGLEREP
jgi:hypothetical protein